MKWVWNRGRADLNPNRAVAAAASLPSSLTSINDLCIAFEKLKDSVYCEATLESKKSVKSDGPSLKIMKIFIQSQWKYFDARLATFQDKIQE